MCAHMLHERLRPPPEAARAAGNSRVRGPHVVHPPQPRAHQPRTDPGNESHGRRTPRLRGRVRAAQPWRAARRRRQRRHFAPGVDRAARAPRPDRRRHRFAHDTQRCSGLHRLRCGQHRSGQFARHRRGAHHRSAIAAHRNHRTLARGSHCEGRRAAPAGNPPHQGRRRRRQGVRVHRRRGRADVHRRARHAHQHDCRARRLHGHRRPRRRDGALSARAARHRDHARALDVQRPGRGVRRDDPHRLLDSWSHRRQARAIRAMAFR